MEKMRRGEVDEEFMRMMMMNSGMMMRTPGGA